MKSRTTTPWLVAAFLAGIVAAWVLTPSRSPAPAPWNPVPSPHESRPILAGVVRLAKTLGWFMIFATPAPEPVSRIVDHPEPQPEPEAAQEVGSDGYAVLRNARGW